VTLVAFRPVRATRPGLGPAMPLVASAPSAADGPGTGSSGDHEEDG
jgi:hypothetical protein